MAVVPDEIQATVKLYLDGKTSRVVFARRWERRHLPGGYEDRGRGAGQYGNAAARESTFDGSRVHSRRAADAAEGTEPSCIPVTPRNGAAAAGTTGLLSPVLIRD
jgi:hypothetical protein